MQFFKRLFIVGLLLFSTAAQADGITNPTAAGTGGIGTVTSVSVISANGVSGTVATPTTTPAITLTLGAITPSSINVGGNLTVTSGSIITTGNISAAAWTTNGIRNEMQPASFTDTSSSGTVTAAYTDLFGASTVLASSATTYTNYFGAYFKDPVASTNVTMTAKWALGADSLRVTGNLQVVGNTLALAGAGGFATIVVNSTTLQAPSDGILEVTNNAGSSFTRMQLGGTTSSFPAIKRNGAALNFRLADDSADAAITASNATLSALANTASTSAVCYNTGTGVLTYDGTIGTCTVSDERLKNMGERIPNALEKLLSINGVYYTWKDPVMGAGRQIGVGAQTVERSFPELVQTDSEGKKSADYARLTAPIIEAMRVLVEANHLKTKLH